MIVWNFFQNQFTPHNLSYKMCEFYLFNLEGNSQRPFDLYVCDLSGIKTKKEKRKDMGILK